MKNFIRHFIYATVLYWGGLALWVCWKVLHHHLNLAEVLSQLQIARALLAYFMFFAFYGVAGRIGMAATLFSLIVVYVFSEGMFVTMLEKPALLRYAPQNYLDRMRSLYIYNRRNIIQLEDACMRYDPDFVYTLKPGHCVFSNAEFSNEFFVNHLGLRDDEDSLVAPEIITVGDSFTMGWGIDQEATYSQILEKELNKKVLNAGISSYETVREIKSLDRLDTSNLKLLIIQHEPWDEGGNRLFALKGERSVQMSAEEYESRKRDYRRIKEYHWFKYIRKLLPQMIRDYFWVHSGYKILLPAASTLDDQAKQFLYALMNAGHKDLSRVNILVFEVVEFGDTSTGFCEALKNEIAHGNYPDYIKRIQIIDFALLLNPREDYYILDDHINAKGQRVIAQELCKAIRKYHLIDLPEQRSSR